MTRYTPHELLEKGLITQEQFQKDRACRFRKNSFCFYELRTLLYLGVMLFTTGAGILIYQNIGSIGHIISIIALTILMVVCFWYVVKHEAGYSPSRFSHQRLTTIMCCF